MNVNEQNNQVPEGWHPDMKPVPNAVADVPILEVDDSSGKVQVEVLDQEEEGRAYWRKKFEDASAENDSYAPYRNILENLKQNGDLVDVLQQHINGEIAVVAGGQESLVNQREEDEYGNPIEPTEAASPPQIVQPTEDQLARAKESGRQVAVAQAELKQFMENLMSTGVPDHIADKFVETISNPTGFNIADLYAAFMNKETRETPEGQDPPVTEQNRPMGSPLSASGGSTDKPTGAQFKETDSDGHNYIANPNAI